ncbi:MAG: hypothetical protein GWP06_15820 [Actinobacteria bacterium]|nr:hypothetical protein [Actinomycetota bacterium]
MIKIGDSVFQKAEKVESRFIDSAVADMEPSLKMPTWEFRRNWDLILKILLNHYFQTNGSNVKKASLSVILRAGIAGLLAAKYWIIAFGMPLYLVWTARDEKTAKASTLNCNLPNNASSNSSGRSILIIDLMLATGTSVEQTIIAVKKCGIKEENITFVVGVAAREGLYFLETKYNIKTIVGFAGPNINLNDEKYIIYLDSRKQVVGDAGDRYMGITRDGVLL